MSPEEVRVSGCSAKSSRSTYSGSPPTASTGGPPLRSTAAAGPAGVLLSTISAAVSRIDDALLGDTGKTTLIVCLRFPGVEGLNFVTFMSHSSPKTLSHHTFLLFSGHEFGENPLVFLGVRDRVEPGQARFEVCDLSVDGMNSDCADDLLGAVLVEFPVNLDRLHRQLGEESPLRFVTGRLPQLSGPERRVLDGLGAARFLDEVKHVAVLLHGEHVSVQVVETGAEQGVLHREFEGETLPLHHGVAQVVAGRGCGSGRFGRDPAAAGPAHVLLDPPVDEFFVHDA